MGDGEAALTLGGEPLGGELLGGEPEGDKRAAEIRRTGRFGAGG